MTTLSHDDDNDHHHHVFSPITGPTLSLTSSCNVDNDKSTRVSNNAIQTDISSTTPSLLVVRHHSAQYGDIIIALEDYNNIHFIHLQQHHTYGSKRGNFSHDDMIDKPFGSKVFARTSSGDCNKRAKPPGWIIILAPTPNLWTRALLHRTQVIYETDIANIILHLHIKEGSVVVESGTGSCSLSTALARAVAPTGRVHTFEFNQDRAAKAQLDFISLGIDHIIHCSHRNVCVDGFVRDDHDLTSQVDAVFLVKYISFLNENTDLPAPFEAIAHADIVLKPHGKICSFSPCIEQIQRTCDVLRTLNYTELVTIECLERSFEFQRQVFPIPDFGNHDEKKYSEIHEDSGTNDIVGAKRARLSKPVCTIPNSMSVSKAFSSMKGHTGYLCFARKPLASLQK